MNILTEVKKKLQLDIQQNPLLNQDQGTVACFRWLPNAWPHCKPFFFPRHSKLAMHLCRSVFRTPYLRMASISPQLHFGMPLSLIWRVWLLCTDIPSEVVCPVAFRHFSSPTRARTKCFYAQESCSLKKEMWANRKILTAGRKWYWKWYLPAWQAAGLGYDSLSFNKHFIGFEKWKGPKDIVLCVFIVNSCQVWG